MYAGIVIPAIIDASSLHSPTRRTWSATCASRRRPWTWRWEGPRGSRIKKQLHAFNVSQKVQTGKYWRLCDGSPSQGELKGVYSRNQFEPLPHPLLSVSDVVRDVELPIITAANKQSQGGGQGFVKCGCVKTCQANNCKCKKANQFCNSRCHKGSNSCLNHE